jgi:RNA-directed DNA polymerase
MQWLDDRSRMSEDVQVRICEHLRGRFPRVTRRIIHCKTEKEAQCVIRQIAERLTECGLELHPVKTKIVYCRDGYRRGKYHTVQFDFLGYSFRPRHAMSRRGNLFLSFIPAVSVKAAKSMRDTIRRWKTHRWTQLTIEELARTFNPVLRGWINYYGQFYRSRLAPILGQFDYALQRWARRKYKRLKGSQTRGRAWIKRLALQNPGLFVHWQITFAGMAER